MGRLRFGFVKKGFKVSVLCEYENENKAILNRLVLGVRVSLSSCFWVIINRTAKQKIKEG